MRTVTGAPKAVTGLIAAAFLLFFFSTSVSFADGPRMPKTVAQDQSIPHIKINGAVFHAETFGDPANPVVIVIHGGPGWDYKSLLPLKRLSDEYFIAFYDQRGTGLSPRVDPKEITLESTIADLDAIVDYFAKGRTVRLIGHSWGGMLATGYIGRHPEKVSHAVLAEPGFLTTEMMKKAGIKFGPRWEMGFLYRASRAWVKSLFIKEPDKDASSDYFIGQIAPYANPEYFCDGIIPEAGTDFWRPGAVAMQAIMKSALNSKGEIEIDLTKGLDRFDKQVLFLASSCNTMIGKEHQARQAAFFRKAELNVIENSGHMMFAEQPDKSMVAIRKYFDSGRAGE